MTIGAGKYDGECTAVRLQTMAQGVILLVVGGIKGSGFSCQASPELTARLPDVLEDVARQIRADAQGGR